MGREWKGSADSDMWAGLWLSGRGDILRLRSLLGSWDKAFVGVGRCYRVHLMLYVIGSEDISLDRRERSMPIERSCSYWGSTLEGLEH